MEVIDARGVGLASRCGVYYTRALKAAEGPLDKLVVSIVELALVAGALDAVTPMLTNAGYYPTLPAECEPLREGEVPF